ncbi:MFS transporter [Caproiciproducens sp. NJN-50]|uniref:MFS transporter n=1 Tax=Acutalibacteraceae TaxID=3082771 RepID=UPI000FFE1499|nr:MULTISPECIES: MFS transporter [Acutalibacteraceae]QAT50265.1 MFS transporter [Caproiciproducens sp. NJN-50]
MRFTMKKGPCSPYSNLPREIYILFAARIVTCMGGFIQPLLTLILTQKLGFSAAEAGGFSAFLTLTQAPAVILGGKLADRIGRKKILVGCQVLGSFFYFLCFLFPDRALMIPCITLAADLYIASMPAYDAMAADLSTPENRQSSFSLIYLGINIGFTVSPILAGLLFQSHLQLMFLIDAGTTLLSTLIIAMSVRETQWRENAELSGLEQTKDDVSLFRLFRMLPVLFFVILFSFSYHFTYSQWTFLLPLQFGTLFGKNSAVNFSMMTALNSLIVVLFTPILTWLTHRRRPLRIIVISGAVFGTSYLLFALARSMPFFLLTGAVFTFGEILESIHFRPYLADHAPPQYLGRVNSFAMFVQGTGSALGPLSSGHMVGHMGYLPTWLFQAAFVLIGTAGILILDEKEKRLENRAHSPASAEDSIP